MSTENPSETSPKPEVAVEKPTLIYPKKSKRRKSMPTENPSETSMDPNMAVEKPIVIQPKKSKKRKSRYSSGLRDIQVMERHLSRALHRVTDAVERGVTMYRKSRDRSASEQRDGAIMDFGLNLAKGLEESLQVTSKVPYDIAQAFNTRGARRRVRRRVRNVARALRAFR